MEKSTTHVFVYGTLKPGERNYHLCSAAVVRVQPAIALGQLYDLPLGYPAMTPGDRLIRGFVLSFATADILQVLDDYEQHDPAEFAQHLPDLAVEEHEYQRQQILTFDSNQTPLGTAWAYRMTQAQVKSLGGIMLSEGSWTSQQDKNFVASTHSDDVRTLNGPT